MTVELSGNLNEPIVERADVAHVAILTLPVDVHLPQLIRAEVRACCRYRSIKQPDVTHANNMQKARLDGYTSTVVSVDQVDAYDGRIRLTVFSSCLTWLLWYISRSRS